MGKGLFGGIEAGGTKFVCAVGTGPDDLREEVRFPTTTPEETLGKAVAYFREQQANYGLQAVGIASFGPVDPDPASPTFGYITSTPKPGWRNTDFGGLIGRALGVPIGFDTDVNGAALGEWRWGAAQGLRNVIYLTVGTGIGGGAVIHGRCVHGMLHPEMGHIRIPHNRQRDPFQGCCPYHNDCLEGLASGKAMELRWGDRAENLAPDHDAWDLEAEYLALACQNLILTLSPQRIIIGGGVMEQPHLLPLIRQKVQVLLADYVQSPMLQNEIDRYIVAPGLGKQAGVLGALALAEQFVSSAL